MNQPTTIRLLAFLCIVLTESYAFILFMPDGISIVQSSRYGVDPTSDGERSDEQQIKQEGIIMENKREDDEYYNDKDRYFDSSDRDVKSYIYDDEAFGDDFFDEQDDNNEEKGRPRLDTRIEYANNSRRNQRRRNRRRDTMPQGRSPRRSRERTSRVPDKIGNFEYGPPTCQATDLEDDVFKTRPDLLDDQDRANNDYETRQGSQDMRRDQEARENDDKDYYYNDSFNTRSRRYQDDRSEYRGRRRNDRRRQLDLDDEDWFDFDGNPITDFIDNLFNIDRDEMEMKADEYEGLIGRQPKRSRREGRASTGYSSRKRYNDNASRDFWDDEQEEEQLVEDEVIVDQDYDIDNDMDYDDDMDANDSIDSESNENIENDVDRRKPRHMSMEERARRLERVPPDGIPAWGPTGDLGLDIRTKMMMDAMDELRSVRSKVNVKEEKTQLIREDIAVLRTDATIESKKQQNDPTRRGRNRLRQILLDIEDAARDLRRAQKLEAIARDELAFLQDKHWALLSLYDVNKASQEISDAFKELSSESATESLGGTVD